MYTSKMNDHFHMYFCGEKSMSIFCRLRSGSREISGTVRVYIVKISQCYPLVSTISFLMAYGTVLKKAVDF